MPPDERLRPAVDRLAQLLRDERGTTILAVLQKLALRSHPATSQPTDDDRDRIGIWRVEVEPDGPALRRCPGVDPTGWARVEYVEPAGAMRRVVLLGESAARGWPYDPDLTCAQVLARDLEGAKPGGYQCVDLAKTGATAAELDRIVARLPLLKPDVVVAFVGNNWTLGQHEIEPWQTDLEQIDRHDAIATALRQHGVAGMRDVLTATTRRRVRGFLDRLAGLCAGGGVEVVVVVPEFNLAGWVPPAEVEVPVLAGGVLARWYRLYAAAVDAGERGWWGRVVAIAARMRQLDGRSSPVPGYLAGTAARRLGDLATARAELEDSRDAVTGLLIRYVPRITSHTQRQLVEYAAARGWACVDLRSVLAESVGGLARERFFHDYCHLSDEGIGRAMGAVAEAVLGGGFSGGAGSGGVGLAVSRRAFGYAHAAAHLAYTGQPAAVVVARLRSALATDAELAAPLSAIRDLLSAARPAWTLPAAAALAASAPVQPFALATARMRGLPPWAWLLRECLAEVVGPELTGDCAPVMDLLIGPDGAAQSLPNWLVSRCYHQATSRRTSLAFALDRPRVGVLELTYRTPDARGGAVRVRLNSAEVARLPAGAGWADASVELPARLGRPGVNRVELDWPVPAPDLPARLAADAAALERGEFPFVLPIFGELFTAQVRLDEPGTEPGTEPGRAAEGPASTPATADVGETDIKPAPREA